MLLVTFFIQNKVLLKSDSHLPKKIVLFALIKNDEKCFLFHLISAFCSQFLSWLFGHIEKSDSIRRIRLNSTFMTSQPGLQTITIHILPNISRSKSNQIMKFGQLIEYNKIIFFLQKSCRKWGRETSFRLLFVFKKSFLWGKSKCSAAYFQYISIALNLAYKKNKQLKTLDYWSRDMLNFDFLEKGLGMVFPPHFPYDFSRKMFLMLYFINWPNFIAWLSLLLDILGNICITIVC